MPSFTVMLMFSKFLLQFEDHPPPPLDIFWIADLMVKDSLQFLFVWERLDLALLFKE